MCSKVALWDDLLASFFFNGPLRAFATMYLDVIFQIIINTKFMSFSNYSQIVSSIICMIVGYAFLYMPFGFMTLIY